MNSLNAGFYIVWNPLVLLLSVVTSGVHTTVHAVNKTLQEGKRNTKTY
jgi:hypothetical protein